MMEPEIMEFVVGEALVLVPALWVLGKFLKSTPYLPDWTIPWALLVAGIGGAVALIGPTPEAVIQGVLVTGAAVLVHQLAKQTGLKDRSDA